MMDASNQDRRQASLRAQYNFIVVGAGAAGLVLGADWSKDATLSFMDDAGIDVAVDESFCCRPYRAMRA